MPSQFPELALGAPEAAETEHRFFRAVRIRALERTVIQKMLGGGTDGVGAARQSLAGLWHGNLLEAEHGCSPAIVPTQYRLGAASPKLPQRSRLGQPATRRLHANGRRVKAARSRSGVFSCARAQGTECQTGRAGSSSVPPEYRPSADPKGSRRRTT